MKVSIIIPYHKGEVYLRDCLDSLAEQTYRDLEVIVVSDHAPQKDLECISEYKDLIPIKLYHLDDNKTGVAAARNMGLDVATGDYIYFLDSDDYLYENTIEELVNGALEKDDDIVYGKKKPTWFKRSIYFMRLQEQQEVQDQELESEENELEDPELMMEGDQDDSDKGEGYEILKQDKEYLDKLVKSEEYINEDELTEEERQLLKEARIRIAYRILVSKRKGVRNISVLNILFKRSFIEENRIRFPENLKYFSDTPFLMEALSKTERIKKKFTALYVKRKHNDAINFPSLSQIKDPNRFYEFIDAYYETEKRIPKNSDLMIRFEQKYITYYAKLYAPRLKRSKNDIWRKDNFNIMSKLVSGMNHEVIKSLRGYKRRIIKALIKQDINKSLRIVKMHLGYRKLKKILHSKKELGKFLYIHVFLKKPMMQNWILFESFFGKNYSDSPKYIYEYISANMPGKYKCIWIIDKKGTKIPFRHKKIKRFSLRYYYYLARCGYMVFNSRQPVWMVKREGNVFLQTWHGTPLKKLALDMDAVYMAGETDISEYKKNFYENAQTWDYLISQNAYSTQIFRRAFGFKKEILEIGYPRNDILFHKNNGNDIDKLKEKLGLPKDKRIILYAPTWRDDEFYDKGKYKFELKLNLDLMKKELGDEYVVLLRTHYFIADSLDVRHLKGFAYNVSKYDDISELYLISDILITDYSSVFFDYANLKRPMLFFTYDLEKYRDVLRGFYIDIEKEVPGPLLFTTEEVVDSIKNIDLIEQKYKSRYEEFYNRFCGWEDGQASKKVVESVFRD